MGISPGFSQWKYQFNITPIILTGGIATSLGGALPIVTLIQGGGAAPASFDNEDEPSPGGDNDTALDKYFAQFAVMGGASLIRNQVGTYPFANQAVAANAIITQPNTVSMMMTFPTTADLPFSTRLSTMTALQNSLSQHCSLGGTFSVVTPSYVYTYCILTDFYEIGGHEKNPQDVWRLDFFIPLVSIQAANTALNGLMQKLSNGTAISGTPTWTPPALPVNNPSNLINTSGAPYLGGIGSGSINQQSLQ